MSVDQFINLVVTIALIEMMLLIGLRVSLAELAATLGNGRLVARALAANYLLVPALTVVLLVLFDASPMVAVGFLVLAACPGAPFGPAFAGIAGASVPVAVGMMVVLAASSAVVAPVLLSVLLPWISGGNAPAIDLVGMLGALLVTQLLPLAAGLMVKHRHPRLAARLLKPLESIGKVLGLGVVVLILATQYRTLAEVRVGGFVGMLLLLAGSLAIGWLAGGSGTANRRSLAITTSLRNVGVGLVIVTGSFAGTAAVTAALAYGIIEVFGTLLIALAWGRRHTAGRAAAGG
jgi:bile acid:Na+ symporter, BASS family